MNILQTISFGEVFSKWKGSEFDFKFLAAKVIHQHMLFFSFSNF